MTAPLTIDVVSDVVCPWCYLGKKRLEAALKGRDEIDHVVSFVGTGAPRFYLPLDQRLPTPNFAQFVVTAKSVEAREAYRHSPDRPGFLAALNRQGIDTTFVERLANG